MYDGIHISGLSRNGFLKRASLSVTFAWLLSIVCLLTFPQGSMAAEKKGVVTVKVDLNAPSDANRVDLWIPYPMSDEYQEISEVMINGNYSSMGVYREGKFGNNILHAEWYGTASRRTLTYTFRVSRKEVVTKKFPGKDAAIPGREFEIFLASTSSGATGGAAKEYADRITEGKNTTLAKAAAIYDWTVENMYRDPDVKGCGLGEVDVLLRKLGGKCADIHSVFVTLARAEGIPAREVFGMRMPKGKEGDMTKAQHCWAEFYMPGYGWVVVDPADVRKAILEKSMTLKEAQPLKKYYFGAVDENRIAFGTGRDLVLNPPQQGEPLNYFMYPYAEADGRPLNEDLYGFNIGYAIGFREL
jgi:transglutaminase-like putative cysteine protease